MYSPKIREDLIPRIFHAAREKKIHMTTFVNGILEKALNGGDDIEEKSVMATAKSFLFRKKMSETLDEPQNQIRLSLLEEGENEVVTGSFKISVKEDDRIEIIELPPADLEQLKLPLTKEGIVDHFDGS